MKDITKYSILYALLIGAFAIVLFILMSMGANFYTPASIVAAVILFTGGAVIKDIGHRYDQQRVLSILKSDIEQIQDNRSALSEVLVNQVFPYWLIHKINVSFYRQNLDRKINGVSTKELLKNILDLSRHTDVLNFNITYVTNNISDKNYVGDEPPEEISRTIAEQYYEKSKYDYRSKEFKELSENMVKRQKALMVMHMHQQLITGIPALGEKIKKVKAELEKILDEN